MASQSLPSEAGQEQKKFPAARLPHFSVLVDRETLAVLTVSDDPSAIIFLTGCTNAIHIPHANCINHIFEFPLLAAAPDHFPEWKYDRDTREFVQTPPETITSDLRELSLLANAKCGAILEIMRALSKSRQEFVTGVIFQDIVYMIKMLEAQKFKESGYNEEQITEFPFVVQYTDFAGLTLRQAADEILFKSKLEKDKLLKTELRRLEFFNKVKNAANIHELRKVLDDFVQVFYRNSHI